jgi:hypothetical protein
MIETGGLLAVFVGLWLERPSVALVVVGTILAGAGIAGDWARRKP